MDFFEAQEAARRRTSLLIALFALAVAIIIAVVYLVVFVAAGTPGGVFDPVLLLQVSLGVGLVIAAGTAVRTSSLRQGGPAVAELLGARRISSDTTDPDERRLFNVVEEMSIASGTPVPAVYVLDAEDGINAFAAGYTTHDAAVAVTRGALAALSRDELQGVIAHEFSHILNGDMRLNIRLIGILYGILLLAVIGRGIVYAGPRGGSRRGKDGGWVVLLGLALLLVGYIGVFFGKLIKAAVSRQREYLADSAAVQFTRNPGGLAGALRKISEDAQGSRVRDHHAEEVSHLFFADGVRSTLFGFLSTHPPIEERIRRLDPSQLAEPLHARATAGPSLSHAEAASRHGFEGVSALSGAAAARDAPSDLVRSVGAPTPEHLAYAGAVLGKLPPPLRDAAHDPIAAKGLIFALLVDANAGARGAEWEPIRAYGGQAMVERVRDLGDLLGTQPSDARLPLLDVSLPALQNLSPAEADRFQAAVHRVVESDGSVRLFEFALLHTLRRRLGRDRGDGGGDSRVKSLEGVREEVRVLLSAVAWSGSGDEPDRAAAAFASAVGRLPSSLRSLTLASAREAGLAQVEASLQVLESASTGIRRHVLEAAAEAVAHDGRLGVSEAQLLRAVSESLDCPLPPLLSLAR